MGAAARAAQAVEDRARALADAVVRALGEDVVEAVFVGGSAARGDVAWCRTEELEVYSDVDLYVVVREGADVSAAREIARAAARGVDAPGGVRFLRPDDVGVYTRGDLFAQPARPGTVRLGIEHKMLHGDGTVVAEMARRIGSDIAPEEGLYLIENRLFEMRRGKDRDDAPAVRLRRYELIKAARDVVAAYLVGRGRYVSGGGEQVAAVNEIEARGELPAGWDVDLVSRAFSAATDLGAEFAHSESPSDTGGRVVGFAVSVWGAIAREVFPAAEAGWGAMLTMRIGTGSYRDNLKHFVAMASALGTPKAVRVWRGLRLGTYAARDALRVSALAAAVAGRGDLTSDDRRALDSIAAYLERLTGASGFTRGTLDERVHAMHAAVS